MRAAALDRGSYPYPSPTHASVALDEEHLRAVLDLWEAWALEDEVETYDENRMVRTLAHHIQNGVWLPVVLWDCEKPVGMVEVLVFEDPFTGEITAYGDHAYLRPEYRGVRDFEKLVDGAVFVADVFGATARVLPVGVKTTFLKPLYERKGFKIDGYVMRNK